MSKPTFYIGTSGWSYDHWKEIFYPKGLKSNQWLPHYAKYFNTVELNMSFYRFPFPNMIKGWKNKLPEGFKMTFKANRNITHRKVFKDVEDNLRKFYDMTENFGENTGCILFQTPPSFKLNDDNFNRIKEFLPRLEKDKCNVMEFRDTSWWSKEVLELLKEYNVAFTSVSGLNMPEDVMISADFAYFRFHGPGEAYASEYSEDQLQQWAGKIKKAIEQYDLKEVYCYFNNDFYGFAIKNAQSLKGILENG